MGSTLLVLYLLAGGALCVGSRASLAEDIARTQLEIQQEQQVAAPWVLVALVYYALALLGWPFFLVITIQRRQD